MHVFEIDTIGWANQLIGVTLPTKDIIFFAYTRRPALVKFTLSVNTIMMDSEDIKVYLCDRLELPEHDRLIDTLLGLIRMYKWAYRQQPRLCVDLKAV